MAYLPPIARLTQHFGLAKVPHDLKDGGQAFLDFVHSVLNADSGPLYESLGPLLARIDATGLTKTELTGRLIDLLIVEVWGEQEPVYVDNTPNPEAANV